jgi:hypothetical protein
LVWTRTISWESFSTSCLSSLLAERSLVLILTMNDTPTSKPTKVFALLDKNAI